MTKCRETCISGSAPFQAPSRAVRLFIRGAEPGAGQPQKRLPGAALGEARRHDRGRRPQAQALATPVDLMRASAEIRPPRGETQRSTQDSSFASRGAAHTPARPEVLPCPALLAALFKREQGVRVSRRIRGRDIPRAVAPTLPPCVDPAQEPPERANPLRLPLLHAPAPAIPSCSQ